MQPTPRAVCVGEGLVVLVARDAGPLAEAGVFDRSAGGAEVNVAGVLAGYGISSAWVSKVGDDGFGRYLVRSVAERGIDVDAVAVDGTRRTGIYVKERGGTTGAEDDLGPGVSRMHYYRQDSAASAMDPQFLAEPGVKQLLADRGPRARHRDHPGAVAHGDRDDPRTGRPPTAGAGQLRCELPAGAVG